MPVEQIFETKEDAPEFLRDHLTETDGKFVFKAELPGEVSGLRNALKAEREAKEKYEKSLKTYDGVDPEKARKLLADQHKAEEEKAKAQGDWENWKKQMQAQHETEKRELEAKLQQSESEFEREFVDAKVTAEIASAKGRVRLLKNHVGAKSVVEDGKRVIRIFEGDKMLYGQNGEPLTITERLAQMRKDPEFQVAFEPLEVAGTGATNNTRPSGSGGTIRLTQAEARDHARYKAAKAEADRRGVQIELVD